MRDVSPHDRVEMVEDREIVDRYVWVITGVFPPPGEEGVLFELTKQKYSRLEERTCHPSTLEVGPTCVLTELPVSRPLFTTRTSCRPCSVSDSFPGLRPHTD